MSLVELLDDVPGVARLWADIPVLIVNVSCVDHPRRLFQAKHVSAVCVDLLGPVVLQLTVGPVSATLRLNHRHVRAALRLDLRVHALEIAAGRHRKNQPRPHPPV